MKKTVFLFLIMIMVSSGSFSQGYHLKGKIPASENGKYIYVFGIDYSGMNGKLTDSCLIKDGSFTFTGKLNTPAMLASIYLRDNKTFFSQFFIENKIIGIDVYLKDDNHLRPGMTTTNNPVTEQYNAYRVSQEPYNRYYQLYNIIDSLVNAKAPEELIVAAKKEQAEIGVKQKEAKIAFFESHRDDYFSLLWMRSDLMQSMQKTPEKMEVLFAGLSADLRALPEGKEFRKAIDALTAIQKGKMAPVFAMQNPDGKVLKLENFRGKYLLIDFWASWCGPCVENFPAVKKAYAEFHGKGLEILSISIDDGRHKWVDAIRKHDLVWFNASELKGWKGDVAMRYNIKYIPKTILLDPQGKIIAVDPDVEKDLPALLQAIVLNN